MPKFRKKPIVSDLGAKARGIACSFANMGGVASCGGWSGSRLASGEHLPECNELTAEITAALAEEREALEKTRNYLGAELKNKAELRNRFDIFVEEAKRKLAAKDAHIAELEEGLAFYADEQSWRVDGHARIESDPALIHLDKGSCARSLLQPQNQKTNPA